MPHKIRFLHSLTIGLSAFFVTMATMFSPPIFAAPVTFEFTGQMNGADSNFDANEPFMGSYTFESTTIGINHPDGSLNLQYVDNGAAWNVVFPGKGYEFIGTSVHIAVGNDTTFGDRYQPTFHVPTNIGNPLPTGQTLSFFQIVLFDPLSSGADLLSDDSIQFTPPNLSLAEFPSGRLLLNPGNDQPRFTLTSLTSTTPVPIPSSLLLFGTGLAGIVAWRWRSTKNA